MSRVFIVRHGNTFARGEIVYRVGIRTDLPLTCEGIEQAEKLGEWFARRRVRFATVLCGSLRRSMTTTKSILKYSDRPPLLQTKEWLNEIDYGPDEGQTEDAVLERVGSIAMRNWETAAIPPPGWVTDASQRIAAWRQFFAGVEGDALLVTSNGAARFALLALSQPPLLASLKLRTGAFGELAKDADRAMQVVCWNVRP